MQTLLLYKKYKSLEKLKSLKQYLNAMKCHNLNKTVLTYRFNYSPSRQLFD